MTHCFIDTHCHFDFPPFSGEETSSIARAAEAGVRAIIVPAIEAARFDKVLALAREHDALYAALGLHPIVIEHHLMTISTGWMPRCKMRIRSWLPSVRSASISIVKIRSLSASRRSWMRSSGWQSATICR